MKYLIQLNIMFQYKTLTFTQQKIESDQGPNLEALP